ncbi:hypothetical protein GCM10007036_21140 [Alsobacter metallidurans]|uniref:Uncharacterized protein n=1 Tax=Alsobacter metallidurans TaxID=340221 RepID=A0A917I861_9HYPH|nr:hypothetical protein [Alsobacter metallidurans]GGH18758.1 hypothetical protein GCM10007036_21140 [Alsobacter metallidurans]
MAAVDKFLESCVKYAVASTATPDDVELLLIRARKLLEHAELESEYPTVKFFGNWCAHPKLRTVDDCTGRLQLVIDQIEQAASVDPIGGSDCESALRSALGGGALILELKSLVKRFGDGMLSRAFDSRLEVPTEFTGMLLKAIQRSELILPSAKFQAAVDRTISVGSRIVVQSAIVKKNESSLRDDNLHLFIMLRFAQRPIPDGSIELIVPIF